MKLLVALMLSSFLNPSLGQFEVPDALIEVFRPRGLRVSIPHLEGIKLFAFHGKINEEMNGREVGGAVCVNDSFLDIYILRPKNERWTFYEPTADIKIGDILYYWTYVDYFDGFHKLGYTNDNKKFEVTELLKKETNGCRESVTTSQNTKNCAGKLIFDENFDSLDPKFWKTENKFAGAPDYEFVIYGNRSENLAVKDGHLEIRPLLSEELYGNDFVRSTLDLGESCTGKIGTTECSQSAGAYLILPPVASAQITTKNKWSFKYGKVEIRAKLPRGDWIYPELYLNPQGEIYGPDYDSGQIRIAFTHGNADLFQILNAGCILGSSKVGRKYAMKDTRKNEGSWCDDFHNFTIIWKPERITVSVDNQVYGQIYPPKRGFANLNWASPKWRTGSKIAPFDKEMYLSIGVGVGGHNFEDRERGSKPWINFDRKGQKQFYQARSTWRPTWDDSSALQVDYVKVWAL